MGGTVGDVHWQYDFTAAAAAYLVDRQHAGFKGCVCAPVLDAFVQLDRYPQAVHDWIVNPFLQGALMLMLTLDSGGPRAYVCMAEEGFALIPGLDRALVGPNEHPWMH